MRFCMSIRPYSSAEMEKMEGTILDDPVLAGFLNGRESNSSDSAFGDDEEDSARKLMNELTQKDGNGICADCGEKRPEWASINLGVFLCIKCAGIHRRLSVSVSKVRSIRLDSWTKEMVQNMAKVGNTKAKEMYEASVPPCWAPPNPDSRHVRLEQWIRAKYERKEFSSPETIHEGVTGTKHGYLYKKMKKTDEWNRRWFVLSRDYLCYYKNYTDRSPKGSIPLSHLNITLDGPGLEAHTNSMLIAYHDVKLRKTRNIFVYAENGKEIMDWYLVIRTAKIQLLQEMFPSRPVELIRESVTRDFTFTGYLCKMPPDHSRWQKRFFVLDQCTLRYYQKPTDAIALGEIFLNSSSQNPVFVDANLPDKLQDTLFSFMLHKPGRSRGGFPLMAESADLMKKWVRVLQEAINSAVEICDPSVISSEYEEDDLYASIDTVLPFSPK